VQIAKNGIENQVGVDSKKFQKNSIQCV